MNYIYNLTDWVVGATLVCIFSLPHINIIYSPSSTSSVSSSSSVSVLLLFPSAFNFLRFAAARLEGHVFKYLMSLFQLITFQNKNFLHTCALP